MAHRQLVQIDEQGPRLNGSAQRQRRLVAPPQPLLANRQRLQWERERERGRERERNNKRKEEEIKPRVREKNIQ